MINLLEGVPGSGKSYEAVVYHVLPALKMGRKVITNLPLQLEKFAAIDPGFLDLIEIRKGPMPIYGRWDAEAANRGEKAFIVGDFTGVESSADCVIRSKRAIPAPTNVRLFGGVWDFYDEWRGEGNIGALFVIDECHVSFPKESVRKGRFTPDEVIQWFKISRHFGVDVLLMTQRMRALDEDVAGLAEMHIRVRKATFLGRPDHYIRKVFAGLNGGEVQSDERPYKPQYFPLYKSHTQGAAVIEAAAQDVAPANVKWRRWSYAMFAIAAIGSIWLGQKIFMDKPEPQKKMVGFKSKPVVQAPAEPEKPAKQAQPEVHQPAAVNPGPGIKKAVMKMADSGPPDPLENRGMHLAGCASMGTKHTCLVSVSQNGVPVFTMTKADLESMGYAYRQLSDCVAMVTWGTHNRTLLCDLPQVQQGVSGVTSTASVDAGPVVRSVPPPAPAAPPEQKQNTSQWVKELTARNESVRSTLTR